MIGLSLSLCISDIVHGVVEEIELEFLVCGLRMRSEAEFDDVIARNRRDYWADSPDEAERIARKLWSESRIAQLRLMKWLTPDIRKGRWVSSMRQIRWRDDLGREVS